MLLYLLAAAVDQPVAVEPPPALRPSQPPHTYLKPPPATCGRGDADEVVVCGATDARYRLQPLDGRKYADAPIRAQRKFGPDTIDIGGKQADVGGFPSNRMMITFTIPF